MQEKGMQCVEDTLPQSKGSKFQPIIPIPKIIKPQLLTPPPVEATLTEMCFVSDRNDAEQLEKYKKECRKLQDEN